MKSKTTRRILAILLTAAVFIGITPIVAFAENGPSDSLAYIDFYNDEESIFLFDNYIGFPIGTIDGATYDQNTNTLSLDHFNQPTFSITANTMGDDFKIELIGENHIQFLSIWGDFHGGSCEFTGTGTLYVNENKLSTTAISIHPEGTDSILKAGGSTQVNAYAPEEGYSLFVSATENENCVVGNVSSTPTKENYSQHAGISVITYIQDADPDNFDFYIKDETAELFAVSTIEFPDVKYFYVYQVVKSPEDDSNILCYYCSGNGDFVPSDLGFTATDEITNLKETGYSSYEPLWKDSEGNQYVFLWEWDYESYTSYYQKYSVTEFVVSNDFYGGETLWYKAIPTDDNTKYGADDAALTEAGYTVETVTFDDLYNLYVTDSLFTLSASAETSLLGDVNGDGDITGADVVLLRRAVAELATLDEDAKNAADVNNDGDITGADVVLLRRFVAELVTSLG